MKFAKYSFIHNRKNSLDKKGTAPVELQIYVKKRQRFLNTGIKLKPEQWNSEEQKVKNNHATYMLLNMSLQRIISDLQNYEL